MTYNGFSEDTQDIFGRFEFDEALEKLGRLALLCRVIKKFAANDSHPKTISNVGMGPHSRNSSTLR